MPTGIYLKEHFIKMVPKKKVIIHGIIHHKSMLELSIKTSEKMGFYINKMATFSTVNLTRIINV